MAAAYLFHIVKNHPFVDGNKRTGAAVADVFLQINGLLLPATNEELYDLVLSIAAGGMTKFEAAEFFRSRVIGL